MIDERIKSYLKDRLKRLEDIKNKREWTTAELGDVTCCKQTLAFINSLQEEPVSEELEEAVNTYIGYPPEVDECSSVYGKRQAFKAGAKWKEKKMMADATEAVVAIDSGGYPYIDKTIELYDYDKDVPLAEEGDKYKVVLIKEK